MGGADGNSVIVQMPTGTGKTYVMASVVKWFIDNHETGEVWIVAHRRELVEQMQQTLDRFCLEYGKKEAVLKAKVRIRVLSIQWLGRHIEAGTDTQATLRVSAGREALRGFRTMGASCGR